MKVKDIEEIAKKYKFVKGSDYLKFGGSKEYRLSFGNIFIYKRIDLVLSFGVQLDEIKLSFWSQNCIDACFHFIVNYLSKVKKSELEDCIKRAIALMKGAKYLRFNEEEEKKETSAGFWSPM